MLSLESVWKNALDALSKDLPRHSFSAWLNTVQPVAVHDNVVLLAVPNNFAKSYLEDRISTNICKTLSQILGREVLLEFVVPPENDPSEQEPVQVATVNPTEPNTVQTPLNPKYTFETFVVGSGNRLAHAASLAVSEAPARAYNPLFIYGGAGLGKTHLMQAIAHQILAKDPRAKVAYVSSETFANELINAIRDRCQIEFRSRYRSADVLLIDDVQFIAGKESTQEEFFHTFNTLHETRRQIVLSSDRPPKEIPTLEERLRSRFEWGLISDIQPPDLETRIAILRKKAQLERISVPDEVMEFIAEKIQTNIRELEGALTRLLAYSSFNKVDINLEVTQEALATILTAPIKRQITIKYIQEVVAGFYNIDTREFQVRKRTRSIAFPRQVAMFLARELTDSSFPKIGEEFGGRDHTTVLHAYEKINRDMKDNSELANVISTLKKQITG